MDDPLIKNTESPTQAAIRWSKRALAAEAQLEPRSMDEAPRDGTAILVRCKFGLCVLKFRVGTTVWMLEGWHSGECTEEYCLEWWPLPTTAPGGSES